MEHIVELAGVPDNSDRSQDQFDICKCIACGHHFTQPFPAKEKMAEYYPKSYYAHMDAKPSPKSRLKWSLKAKCYRSSGSGSISDSPAKVGLMGRLLAEPPFVGEKKLLDIGCGSGEYLKFAENCGWSAFGLELDEEAVARGQKNGLAIKSGSAESIPYESGTFDVVRMWHVLEHAYSPSRVLTEVNRVLRPNGLFLLSVPNYDSSQRRVLGKYWPHLDVPRHLHHFSPGTLEKALASHGFRRIETFFPGFPLMEIPWRLAIMRMQGVSSLQSKILLSKTIAIEVINRIIGRDQGSLLTWLVRKEEAVDEY